MVWWVWAVIGIALLVLESMHGAFVLSVLGVGALAAAVMALLLPLAVVTVPTFAVVSIVGLFTLRPWAVRRFGRRGGMATNVDALVGRTAQVLVPFEPETRTGRVVVGAEQWRARLEEGWAAPGVGGQCTVLSVDGNTLQVCPEDLGRGVAGRDRA